MENCDCEKAEMQEEKYDVADVPDEVWYVNTPSGSMGFAKTQDAAIMRGYAGCTLTRYVKLGDSLELKVDLVPYVVKASTPDTNGKPASL